MRRIRVLFFVGTMGAGGAEQQVAELLTRIDRQKFEPHLYLHHRMGPFLERVPGDVPIHSFWDQFAGTLRSKFHHLMGTTNRARQSHLAGVARAIRADLVYNRTHLATIDSAAAFSGKQIRRISVCDSDPIEEIRKYSSHAYREAVIETRDAYDTADTVVAVSSGIRDKLIDEIGVDQLRCEVHPNLIDVDAVQYLSQANPAVFREDVCNILSVSRLSSEKGHKFLLLALDSLVHCRGRKDLHWHIVGTGPLQEELESQVNQHGLSSYVTFHGYQENPYRFMAAADLFCLPSLHEAFGIVLIEAMCVSLPILATDCPSGPREVLDGGRFGRLVPPGNAEAIASGIQDFLSSKDQWCSLTEHSADFVREQYSFVDGVERLQDLFLRVVNKKESG